MNLNPYTGPWTFTEAAHLLRRTTFGPTFSQISAAVTQGLDATITTLLADQPLPDLPINYDFADDPTTPVGSSWVGQPLDNSIPLLNTTRNVSLNAWQLGLINEGGMSIREKLVLFWHNHFVTSAISRSGYNFDYLNTLRRNALGNFRTLAEEISISPSMLIYLNGNDNSKQAPNENYSRELLELFTIGKGAAAGPGDYTNYTEDDVAAMAKALTGWRATDDNGFVSGVFVNNRHDETDKQLSVRFGNAVINNEGENEYKTVIDIILQQDETARYLSRRLHIWFVGSDIDATVETNIIEPMAALIRDNNYELLPALEALIKSEYFFDESIRGCMVNHPIDLVFKFFNTFELIKTNDIFIKYRLWIDIFRKLREMDMEILGIASVAGWKAFHQGPQYYDVWINSVSLPIREAIVDSLLNGFNISTERIEIDTLEVISKINGATDPNALIVGLSNTLFPFPISQGQIDFLKEVLIPGLPDFEWTVEYGDYLADPSNMNLKQGVETKLNALFNAMLKMPEMHLI